MAAINKFVHLTSTVRIFMILNHIVNMKCTHKIYNMYTFLHIFSINFVSLINEFLQKQ